MWSFLARIIIRNRVAVLSSIIAITVFFGYKAKDVTLDYQHPLLLPDTDTAIVNFNQFKETFKPEGFTLIYAVSDSNIFEKDKINDWIELQNQIKEKSGVTGVFSFVNTVNLEKNALEKKLKIINVFPEKIKTQEELDSIKTIFLSLPFYKDLAYFPEKNVYLASVSFSDEILAKQDREVLMDEIVKKIKNFESKYKYDVKISGIAYYRTQKSLMVQDEVGFFIFLAVAVTAIILFLFFRSFKILFFSLIIVGTSAVWAFGTMALFGYKITVLTAMLPTLLIVIGIPNSVFLLNKFHQEFKKHNNKLKAIHRTVVKVGNATFLTNLTTATGFATFIITGNPLLTEFGIIASINIMGVFILSITLIPVIFSSLADPREKHIKHLEFRLVNKVIDFFVHIVTNRRKLVYVFVLLIITAGVIGIYKVKTLAHVFEDIPEDGAMFKDFRYLENISKGALPLEVVVKKKKDSIDYYSISRINDFQKKIQKYSSLSRSMSIADAIKFSNQAFYRGKSKFYKFPDANGANRLKTYFSGMSSKSSLIKKYIDSTYSKTRISLRIKDVGTNNMEILVDSIQNDLDSIFPPKDYKTYITGSALLYMKGTSFLVHNLITSLVFAILIISALMAFMFASMRMIIVSVITNLLPLMFTGALMGYFGITLKPSTILVFSISFGIAVDNAIHFLAKYRQELQSNGITNKEAVVNALRETGISIFYSVSILFFGFLIFTGSKFGGTIAMGVLVSVTLLFAMISNLILLPSILLSLKPSIQKEKK